jgi:hypothetical protein
MVGGYGERYFFRNMDDRIVYALNLQFRRFYNFSLWYVILPFVSFCLDWNMVVCISVMHFGR